MSSQFEEVVKELFLESLDVPAAERPEWLAVRCGGDAAVRDAVLRMLKRDQSPEGKKFLEAIPHSIKEQFPAIVTDHLIGQTVEAYCVQDVIGRGGYGTVYRAVRTDDFQQQVAIKFLHSERDTPDARRRFFEERQFLASLNHPYIVRLFSGGSFATDEGEGARIQRPYLIMEYVEGTPLDGYCADRRLDVYQRLRLFQKVCQGVHHTHTCGLIHRDLKPGNVLVVNDEKTREAIPKVLDFGIAQPLNPLVGLQSTEPGTGRNRLLTYRYASPEQVGGKPCTVYSDVYSLGVMLYELLAGCHPTNEHADSPREFEARICEYEPSTPSAAAARESSRETESDADESPSTNPDRDGHGRARRSLGIAAETRLLRGDVDAIVMKALQKSPHERYASVSEMVADIERYFQRMPVIAREGGAGYLLKKFVLRHRAVVASAAVALLAVVLGGLGATWGMFNAQQSEKRAVAAAGQAKANADRAERHAAETAGQMHVNLELVRMTLSNVDRKLEHVPGAQEIRAEVLQGLPEQLDIIARSLQDSRLARRELALVRMQLGSMYLRSGTGAQDSATQKGKGEFTTAYKILEDLNHKDTRDRQTHVDLASVMLNLGDAEEKLGQFEEARNWYQSSMRIREMLRPDSPDNRDLHAGLSACYDRMGNVSLRLGDTDTAHQWYLKSVGLLASDTKLLESRTQQRSLIVAYTKLGDVTRQRKDASHAEAKQWYDKAVKLAEALRGDAEDAIALYALAAVISRLGDDHLANREFEAASSSFETVYRIAKRLHLIAPNDAQYRRNLALVHRKLAHVAIESKDVEKALTHDRESLKLVESLRTADPKRVQYQRDHAKVLSGLGIALAKKGELTDALTTHEKALSVRETIAANHPYGFPDQRELGVAQANCAETLHLMRKLKGAEKSFARAIEILESLCDSDPGNAGYHLVLSTCLQKAAGVQLDQYRHEATRDMLTASVNHLKVARATISQEELQRRIAKLLGGLQFCKALDEAIEDPEVATRQKVFPAAHLLGFRSIILGQRGDFEAAADAAERIAALDPQTAENLYNSACLHARLLHMELPEESQDAQSLGIAASVREQSRKRALELLQGANALGMFDDPAKAVLLHDDEDLRSLRENEAFQSLVDSASQATSTNAKP